MFHMYHKNQLIDTLQVTFPNRTISKINALAYHHGKIYANIWFGHEILVIDELTGRVITYYDLADLVELYREIGVLNGLTIVDNQLIISGKNWKYLYTIDLELLT